MLCLTCEICPLIDVCEGVIVCEAQFLIKIVPGPCFSKTNISSMCFPIALQYNNGPQLEIANFYCEINGKENKLAALLRWTIVDLLLSIDCKLVWKVGEYSRLFVWLADWHRVGGGGGGLGPKRRVPADVLWPLQLCRQVACNKTGFKHCTCVLCTAWLTVILHHVLDPAAWEKKMLRKSVVLGKKK